MIFPFVSLCFPCACGTIKMGWQGSPSPVPPSGSVVALMPEGFVSLALLGQLGFQFGGALTKPFGFDQQALIFAGQPFNDFDAACRLFGHSFHLL